MKTAWIMHILSMGSLVMLGYTGCARAAELPDPDKTPGVINHAVTMQNAHSTICKPGYTKAVRHVTAALKARVYARYKLKSAHDGYCAEGCEVDHLIPQEIQLGHDVQSAVPPRRGELDARAGAAVVGR
jgi:hypothetical protein